MASGRVLSICIYLCLRAVLPEQSSMHQHVAPALVLQRRTDPAVRGGGEDGKSGPARSALLRSSEAIPISLESLRLEETANPSEHDVKKASQLTKVYDLHELERKSKLELNKPMTEKYSDGSSRPCFSVSHLRNPEHPGQDLHPAGRFSKCGEPVCDCMYWNGNSTLLVAMCNHTGLQFVPTFSGQTVRYLMFYSNGLRNINGSSFFVNVQDLCRVDLDHNQLTSLPKDVFELLPKLEYLRVSDNLFLDISKNIHPIFSVRSLRILDISNTYFGLFPNTTFIDYPMNNLEKLFVHNSAMRIWNLNLFQPLKMLQYLGMLNNDLISVEYDSSDSTIMQVTVVDLSYNDIYTFPNTCCNSSRSGPSGSMFPYLRSLDLKGNRIISLPRKVCLPSLLQLKLSFNEIKRFHTDMFHGAKFPQLAQLYLDRLNAIIKSIQAYAFNNSKLQLLSLMYNNIDFSSGGIVDDAAFRGLTGLLTLQLEHNYGLIEGRLAQLFWDSTNLQNLQLGNTFMDTITPDTFSRFPNLVNLSLYHNPIVSLSPASFDGLLHLKFLDLSSCWIVTLSPDHFSAATRGRLTHLDLSGNTFLCDCDLMWLRDWLSQNESRYGIFSNSYTSYQCHNPLPLRGTNVTDFRLQKQSCLISRMTATLVIVVVTLLILLSVIFTGLYRFRWHMRLFLYEAFRGKSPRLMLPANYFRYDVFVSYAEEDLPWVRKHLLTKLERNLGLRLCLHQRDFMPGQNIVDNIFNSVQNSRKLLMVFSRAFARSQWCQFELAMCLQHVIDNDDTLVIVSLDDVTSVGCSELTTTMMAVLLTTTYIQWAEKDGHAIRSFWARLGIALTEVLYSLAPTANINSSSQDVADHIVTTMKHWGHV